MALKFGAPPPIRLVFTWPSRVPKDSLNRTRLVAVGVGGVAILSQLAQVGNEMRSPQYSPLAATAIVMVFVILVVTYLRGRTRWWNAPLIPVLVAIGGSGLRDPLGGMAFAMSSTIVPVALRLHAAVGGPGRGRDDRRGRRGGDLAALRRPGDGVELAQRPQRAPPGPADVRTLQSALASAEDGSVALLNVDLDDFKQVNDGHGHHAGDELLVEVASRMVEVAAGRGLAGRFGVDEFALLLTGLTSPFEAVEIAEVLSARLAAPSRLTVGTVAVGASIGVAVAEARITVAELTRRADEAMYAAKAAGKNRVEAFRPAATCPTPYTPPPASRPPWVAREASARGAAR